MERFGLLLFICIPLVKCFYEQPQFPIEPKGYRIDFHPHIEDGIFKGRVRIDIVNRGSEPVTDLKLNAHSSLNVTEKDIKLIRLANADLSDEESEEDMPISVRNVERKEDLLIVYCSQKLQRDATYQLDIHFEGKLATDPDSPLYKGSYVEVETKETRDFLVLSPQIGQAYQIFPCFDKPFLKSWFEISVIHKKNSTALSNMPVLEQSNVTKNGTFIRDLFSRTPLMTLNSLGLFISDFKMPQVEYVQTDGIKIGLWGRADFVSTLSKAQQILPSVLVSLELYLSRPYPLPHLNLIALPGFLQERPKDSWGLQWFKESDLMNGNSYWLTHRVAKAAAIQWLGHLATPINDSVVTTGLASFLATNVAKQLEPTMYNWNLGSFHTLVLELGKPRNYGLDSEQRRTLTENRVSLLIQMLEEVFSPATFKQAIQNFLAKKEFKAYSDDDLWQIITEQTWVDGKLSSSISLGEVVSPWLSKKVPLVTVSVDYSSNTTTFTQEEFVDNLENSWSKVVKKGGVDKLSGWWIPLVVDQGANETTTFGWMSPTHHSLSLKNISVSSYITVNPGSSGPYLVNYDDEGWRRVVSAMKTLPVTYRAQLLHDSMTLALSGHLNTVTALNVTATLKSEQAPEVWRTFYPLAERLRKRFQGTEAAGNLDAYLKLLLIPVLDALGEEDKSSWKTELRVRTRHLLCQTGFTPCVDGARSSFAIWVNASHPDEGMPIASSHLCPVMAWGTFDEWEFALNRLSNFPTNRSRSERTFLMKAIAGCPREEKKFETLLNVTFLDDTYNNTFSDEDKYIILSAVSGESIGYSTLFKFLKSNWDTLKSRLTSGLWEFLMQCALGNFRTSEGLQQVTELLQDKKSEMGNAFKTAEDSVARVQSKVKWAKESTPGVVQWLNATMENSWTAQRFKFQDVIVISHRKEI